MKRRELKVKWVVRERVEPPEHEQYGAHALRGPAELAHYLSPLASEPQEVAWAIFLDARMRILGYREVGRGSIESCPMDPRQVYSAALLAHAAAVILAHNHPSGDVTPSDDDIKVTARIKAGLETLDIPLLDHVIVGGLTAAGARLQSLRELGKC